MGDFLFYAISIGLNRGVVMLLIPVLASVMQVEDLANFSLYLITGSLLLPIITFNISAVVGREVFNKPAVIKHLVKSTNRYLIILFLFSIIFAISSFGDLSTFFLFLIGESLFLVNSNYTRFSLGVQRFFKCCMIKALITLVLIFGIKSSGLPYLSSQYVLVMISFANIIALLFCGTICLKGFLKFDFDLSFYVNQKKILLFGLALLPHTFSQWITSGSDKYIIKIFSSSEDLATYSLAYSLASVFMLVNGALALGVPHLMVKDYNKYLSAKFRKIYFLAVIGLYLFISLCARFGISYYYADTVYNISILQVISQIVLAGLFLLSFYYYYSTEIFYQKKSKTLSLISLVAAIFNIVFSVILLDHYGIIGVAIATYFTYLLYYTLSLFFSGLRHYTVVVLSIVISLIVPFVMLADIKL